MFHLLSDKKLSDTVGQKSENLHLMRFGAALLVILSHSFVFSKNSLEGEWLVELTGAQLTMGGLAVSIFFLCGGYLIAMSMEKSKTAKKYFEARLIRLLPPLFFVTFALVLLGGFLTQLPVVEYYTSIDTWKYMLNSVFVLTHNLPGVFTNNISGSAVNGALWTLPVEFVCYVLCFIAYKLGFLEKKRFPWSVPLVIIGTAGVWIVGGFIPIVREVIRPVLLFYIGMGYWIYREQIRLTTNYFLIAVAGFVLSFLLHFGYIGMLLFFPYIMFTMWFGFAQCSSKIGKIGNYSYGIYLWGCPVQQSIVYFMGGEMNPYLNFMIAIPIAIILGMVTYEISEKRFMTWYKSIR